MIASGNNEMLMMISFLRERPSMGRSQKMEGGMTMAKIKKVQ